MKKETFFGCLKSESHLPKKIALFATMKALEKMIKNAYYFILKALFVVKIFKFLFWLSGHVKKTAWFERYNISSSEIITIIIICENGKF